MTSPKINYQLMLDAELERLSLTGTRPRLMLHACCAPCSTYVLDYLTRYFDIDVLYYNPNIYPEAEYEKRRAELVRLIDAMSGSGEITLIDGDYGADAFACAARGFENEREGGARCERCFRLRLEKTAAAAKSAGADYFTTTLTVSPYKNSQLLNVIGAELSTEYGVKYLFSDFKKRGGYLKSIEMSAKYGLYRQHYCGCEFSLAAAENISE